MARRLAAGGEVTSDHTSLDGQPEDRQHPEKERIDDLIFAGSFLIGLYWTVINLDHTLSVIFSTLQNLVTYNGRSLMGDPVLGYGSDIDWAIILPYLIINLLPVIFGILLMLGSGTMVKLFRKVRGR